MQNSTSKNIIFYATKWCGDCFHSRHLLKDAGVDFVEINIDNDELAAKVVMDINHGNKSVPTIVFPNGSILVEPSNIELIDQIREYQK